MSPMRTTLAALLMVCAAAMSAPALADSGYGVGMYFADANGKVTPTLFSDQNGTMDLAVCKARLEYLTKKFYRMVRNNMHEFDDMKLVKSECAKVDNFDFGSN
jgi:hypothetical protein